MATFLITNNKFGSGSESVFSKQDVIDCILDHSDASISANDVTLERNDNYNGEGASTYIVYVLGQIIGRVDDELQ
jgi:hypothetical protein